MAGRATLEQSLLAIVRLVEKVTPRSICSILLCDGPFLHHGAGPSLPADFIPVMQNLPVREGAGACGTAAFRKQQVTVEDVSTDPLMHDYRELLDAHGIRACWSTPVLSGEGEVLATFAVYQTQPGMPDPADQDVMATATRLAGIALERARSEAALAATNRALQMLSRSCIALNRFDDEASLLAEICRVAVEEGGYRMAWVGYAQNDALRSIRPMSQAGVGEGYLESLALSWSADTLFGRGPAGQVIRSGQPQQSGDIARGDNHFHRLDLALAQGYRSVVILPLCYRHLQGQRVGCAEGLPGVIRFEAELEPPGFGMLALYTDKAQHFTGEEVKLLQELADNLAFGIGNLRNRLELRRSLQAAREAAARLNEQASLLDRAQDAIMVRNLDSTIRYWSKGAERLYGWTEKETLGRTMVDQMYRSPQVLANAMQQALESGGDWNGELEQVGRDGTTVHVQARWTLVRDEHGVVNGVLGINTDIRERRRWREQILELNANLEDRVHRRTAQLEFANQQLEAFSYSVSHDLRTPLSSVDGFCSLLEKSLGAGEPESLALRHRHYLSRIRAGMSQMGGMIDAMLALAQVSRSSLRWEPVDLSALALALLAGYQEREPGRAARLQVEPNMIAEGDPRLLNLVLDNLLGNAWKFSAGQACTDIVFARESQRMVAGNPIEAGRPAADSEAVYVVRDRGVGFDMAYADKLFGPFQRLHSPAEFAGSGIGLTTVQRIVSRHGGRVWGESAPGKGAAFYFTLGTMKL